MPLLEVGMVWKQQLVWWWLWGELQQLCLLLEMAAPDLYFSSTGSSAATGLELDWRQLVHYLAVGVAACPAAGAAPWSIC